MATKEKLMKTMLKGLVLSVAAVTLSACQGPLNIEYGFAWDSDHIVHRNAGAKQQAVAAEEFKMNLMSVVDRRPANERVVKATSYDKIYEYDPNKLLQGMNTYVKSTMGGRLARMSDGNYPLVLDIEVERFTAKILRGGFIAGPYGKYDLDIVLHVIVRDRESEILLTETVSYDDVKGRNAFRGHHPTAQMDKDAMRGMINEAFDELVQDIGWHVHKAFNAQRKYYAPESFESNFENGAAGKSAIPAS